MHRAFFGLLAALLLLAAPARAVTFGFDSLAPTNAQVPFSLSIGGLTARFSSPAGAGAFIALDGSPFATLGSSAVANDNFNQAELDIAFSQSLNRIAFNFATNDNGAPTALTLTATRGGIAIGSVTTVGGIAASGLPEGSLLFTNADFDGVRITDTDASNAGFAIGAVVAQVPEPAALAILAPALFGVLARRRRA